MVPSRGSVSASEPSWERPGNPGQRRTRGPQRKSNKKRVKGKGVVTEMSLAEAIQQLPEGNTEQFLAKKGMVRDLL